MPSWPEFSDFWADILQPFLHALAIAVFCFGPLSVFAIWSGIEFALNQTVNPGLLLGTLLAAGWAMLYFPMAMLAVAMADSLSGLNPLFVIPSICKVPLEYLAACCVVLFGTWARKLSATEWRKSVAHGASRGNQCGIAKSPVRGDRIPTKENGLSPLRGSDF